MHLAEEALSEGTRQRLLARNRALLRDGYERLSRWIEGCEDGLLSITPPELLPSPKVRPVPEVLIILRGCECIPCHEVSLAVLTACS